MPQGEQVKNGKAFEFSLAYQYYSSLRSIGKNVELVESSALNVARDFYNSFSKEKKEEFDIAAKQTIDTMLKIEPGLHAQKNGSILLSKCWYNHVYHNLNIIPTFHLTAQRIAA